MKIRYHLLPVIATVLAAFFIPDDATAQQYKLQHVTSMMNMKSESTIYVKGMRKR